MDERWLAHATKAEQNLRDDAVREINREMSRPGQPYCDECGEVIPDERRAAYPAAHRCITCQTTFEILKKGHAR